MFFGLPSFIETFVVSFGYRYIIGFTATGGLTKTSLSYE